MATLEQQIAQKQDELARLKEKAQKQENAQKIVLGGMVLSVARKDKNFASQLLAMMNTEINRDTDKKRLVSVFDELKEIVNPKPVVLDSEPSMSEQVGGNHG